MQLGESAPLRRLAGLSTPIAVPATGATFEAEHFNCGGQDVAYHDNVAGNNGGKFRPAEDIDLIASTDSAGGGYVIQNLYTGEWLTYTINVAQAGAYDLAIRASADNPGSFHLEIDGVDVSGDVPVPNTGSLSNFVWVTQGWRQPHRRPARAQAGERPAVLPCQPASYHALRPLAGFATQGHRGPTTARRSAATRSRSRAAATTFEAEHFNCGGEGLAYHDSTSRQLGRPNPHRRKASTSRSCRGPGRGHTVVNDSRNRQMAHLYDQRRASPARYDLSIGRPTAARPRPSIWKSAAPTSREARSGGEHGKRQHFPVVHEAGGRARGRRAGPEALRRPAVLQPQPAAYYAGRHYGSGCSGDNAPTQQRQGRRRPGSRKQCLRSTAWACTTTRPRGPTRPTAPRAPAQNSGCKVWMRYRKAVTATRHGARAFPCGSTRALAAPPAACCLSRTTNEVAVPGARQRSAPQAGSKYYFRFGTGPAPNANGSTRSQARHGPGQWPLMLGPEGERHAIPGPIPSPGNCPAERSLRDHAWAARSRATIRSTTAASGTSVRTVCLMKRVIDRGGAGTVEVENPDRRYWHLCARCGARDCGGRRLRRSSAMWSVNWRGNGRDPHRAGPQAIVMVENIRIWAGRTRRASARIRAVSGSPTRTRGENRGWNEVGAIHIGGRASIGDPNSNNSRSIVIREKHDQGAAFGCLPVGHGRQLLYRRVAIAEPSRGSERHHPGQRQATDRDPLQRDQRAVRPQPDKSHRWLKDGIGGKSDASAAGIARRGQRHLSEHRDARVRRRHRGRRRGPQRPDLGQLHHRRST